MLDTDAVPLAPPPGLRFRRRVSLPAALRELWQAREIVRSLAERDLRARYKQATLGFAWSLAQPLSLVLVFTVLFRRIVPVDTAGAPYAVFALLGLLPWQFFSSSLSQGGLSLLSNVALLNKVYCPREVFPLAGLVVAAVDTLLASLALVVACAVTGVVPRSTVVMVPMLVVVEVVFVTGVTLFVSSVVVYLRDLRHALPIALQFGLFATPVAYDLSAVPGRWHLVYCALNPLAAVIDGVRGTVLYGHAPAWDLLGVAAASSALWLLLGWRVFKRLETGVADLL
jgi:ABC-2 type transport system permease protein/lipopolysaccharide transport system permease protein